MSENNQTDKPVGWERELGELLDSLNVRPEQPADRKTLHIVGLYHETDAPYMQELFFHLDTLSLQFRRKYQRSIDWALSSFRKTPSDGNDPKGEATANRMREAHILLLFLSPAVLASFYQFPKIVAVLEERLQKQEQKEQTKANTFGIVVRASTYALTFSSLPLLVEPDPPDQQTEPEQVLIKICEALWTKLQAM